jgi:hypothetical protein
MKQQYGEEQRKQAQMNQIVNQVPPSVQSDQVPIANNQQQPLVSSQNSQQKQN